MYVGVFHWLRGLAGEAAGNGRTALAHLRHAMSADLSAVPLYRAHVQVDHARLAFLTGDTATAMQSLDLAGSGYARLGADACLHRVDELRQRTSAASARHQLTALARSDPTMFGLPRS